MSDDQIAARAAQAILRRLEAKKSIETQRPEELVREMIDALDPYEHTIDAIATSVLATATSLAMAQNALERRALGAGAPLDEEGLPALLARISALLLASDNVEELFVDDAELSRIVRAALLDYLPSVASRARAKLAAAFVKPRATLPPSQKPESIADDGYAFPLFEGPLGSAAVDDAGPCAFCGAPSEVRFAEACYACFRAGKATAHVMDTELGAVRAGEVAEGARQVDTAALEELLRTPKYETWQGERWLFCCKRPMVFIGPMREPLLERLRESEQTQEEVVAKLLQLEAREAHKRTAEVLKGKIAMYVFRCASCKKHRAHWDSA